MALRHQIAVLRSRNPVAYRQFAPFLDLVDALINIALRLGMPRITDQHTPSLLRAGGDMGAGYPRIPRCDVLEIFCEHRADVLLYLLSRCRRLS